MVMYYYIYHMERKCSCRSWVFSLLENFLAILLLKISIWNSSYVSICYRSVTNFRSKIIFLLQLLRKINNLNQFPMWFSVSFIQLIYHLIFSQYESAFLSSKNSYLYTCIHLYIFLNLWILMSFKAFLNKVKIFITKTVKSAKNSL